MPKLPLKIFQNCQNNENFKNDDFQVLLMSYGHTGVIDHDFSPPEALRLSIGMGGILIDVVLKLEKFEDNKTVKIKIKSIVIFNRKLN